MPKEDKIKVDEVQVTPVTKHVTAFRSISTQRLKFEIEYGLKRGTTDNSYVIQVLQLLLLTRNMSADVQHDLYHCCDSSLPWLT